MSKAAKITEVQVQEWSDGWSVVHRDKSGEIVWESAVYENKADADAVQDSNRARLGM